MVKKGILSSLTTIGYGLIFLTIVIVAAVAIQIGIYGVGEKNEAVTGLEISHNKTLVVQNDDEEEIGTLSLSIKSGKLSGRVTLDENLTNKKTALAIKIGDSLVVKKDIADITNFEFTDRYYNLYLNICAIITDGTSVLAYAETEDCEYDHAILLNEYINYIPGTNQTVFSSSELLVSTTNTEEQITLSILGSSTKVDEFIDSSLLKVELTIKTAGSSGSIMPMADRPVNFFEVDKDGNITPVEKIVVRVNQTFKLALATEKKVNNLVDGAYEKDYIKGGYCYLCARSTDNLWQAESIKIAVDVPIESLQITVNGYNKLGQAGQDLTSIVNNTAISNVPSSILNDDAIITTKQIQYDENNKNQNYILNLDKNGTMFHYTGKTTSINLSNLYSGEYVTVDDYNYTVKISDAGNTKKDIIHFDNCINNGEVIFARGNYYKITRNGEPVAGETNYIFSEVKSEGVLYSDVIEKSDITAADFIDDNNGKTFYYAGDTKNLDTPLGGIIKLTKGKYYRVEKVGDTFSLAEKDLQYFIKNDQLTLSVKTFPENALSSLASEKFLESKLRNVSFTNTFNTDWATLSAWNYNTRSGILTINGSIDGNVGELNIGANIIQGYGSAKKVDTGIKIYSTKLEIESIEIGNDKVSSISVEVGKNIRLSANGVVQDATNLQIQIKSKHYTNGTDPSMLDLLSGLQIFIVDNHASISEVINSLNIGYRNALVKDSQVVGANVIWTLTANREPITGEDVHLYVQANNTFDINMPYTELNFEIITINPIGFAFSEDTDKSSISITKYDEYYASKTGHESTLLNETTIDVTSDFISYTNYGMTTYTKWVYFTNTNKNSLNEPILKASASQICNQTGGSEIHYSENIQALNAGTASILAFLVRTNSNGDPIDYKFNVITDLNTGYVLGENIVYDAVHDYSGKFVVEYQSSLKEIEVVEELTEVAFFYDITEIDPGEGAVVTYDVDDSDIIGADDVMVGVDNDKVIYFIGNSISALQKAKDKLSLSYVMAGNNDEIYLSIDQNLLSICIEVEIVAGYYWKIEAGAIGKIEILVNSECDFEVSMDIIIDEVSQSVGSFNCNADEVVVESVGVKLVNEWMGYYIENNEGFITTGGLSQLSNAQTDSEIVWKYTKDSYTYNDEKMFPYEIFYNFNEKFAGHGNNNLHSTNPVYNQYIVCKLTDAEKTSLNNASDKTAWFKDKYSTIKCQYIETRLCYDEENKLNNLKWDLSLGWDDEIGLDDEDESNNMKIIMLYAVTNSDDLDGAETTWLCSNYYELEIDKTVNLKASLTSSGDLWDWDWRKLNNGVESYIDLSATTPNRFDNLGIIDGTGNASIDGITLELFYDSTEHPIIINDSGILKCVEGYSFTETYNIDNNNIWNHRFITINYYLFDNNSGITFKCSMQKRIEGYIIKS